MRAQNHGGIVVLGVVRGSGVASVIEPSPSGWLCGPNVLQVSDSTEECQGRLGISGTSALICLLINSHGSTLLEDA